MIGAAFHQIIDALVDDDHDSQHQQSQGDQGEAHGTAGPVGSPKGKCKAGLGAVGGSEVGAGGDDHADAARDDADQGAH